MQRHVFASSDALAEALATRIGDTLRVAIAQNGKAVLALSGGRTPVKLFAALARQRLDWRAVTVTLVDERYVAETSERSNARLLRQHMMQGEAARAQFLPLFHAGRTPEQQAAALNANWGGQKLTAAVLGMGDDGHTASWFPHAEGLEAACAPDAPPFAVVRAEAAGEPRITMTLPLVAGAGLLCLHIEGENKQQVLAEAQKGDDWRAMPVRLLLKPPLKERLQVYLTR